MGKLMPAVTENRHSNTIVTTPPDGTMKPIDSAIAIVSRNTDFAGPIFFDNQCGRAAARASKIVMAASTEPYQLTETSFDSSTGWNRFTCRIRTSVNIAMPWIINSSSQRDLLSAPNAPPTPASSLDVFPSGRVQPGIGGSFDASTTAIAALIAVNQYGDGMFHCISRPMTGQY